MTLVLPQVSDPEVQQALDVIARAFPLQSQYLVGIYSGAGTPEGVVTAAIGSIFRRSDGGAGTSLYVKESGTGNTGWVGK